MEKRLKILIVIQLIISLGYIILSSVYSTSFYVSLDSLWYLRVAKDLPEIKTTTFPLLLPLVLKGIMYFKLPLILSFKFINIGILVLIFSFSYRKDFYFKETVILFTSLPFISFYLWFLSESWFYLWFYLFLYYLNNILNNSESENKKIILGSVMLFLMILTKYLGVFILIFSFIFSVYFSIKKRKNLALLKLCFITLFFTTIYLGINYISTGVIMGHRGNDNFNLSHLVKLLIATFDPFKSIPYYGFNLFGYENILGNNKIKIFYYFSCVVIFLLSVIFLYKRKKTIEENKFYLFLLLCSVFVLMGLIYSYKTTYLDYTHRILSPAFFTFYFIIIIFLMKYRINMIIILIWINVFITLVSVYRDIKAGTNRIKLIEEFNKVKLKKGIYKVRCPETDYEVDINGLIWLNNTDIEIICDSTSKNRLIDIIKK